MASDISIPMNYFAQGDFQNAMLWVFTDYVGYGIVWAFWMITIFAVTYNKNKSAAIGGFFLAFAFAVMGGLLPVEVQPYFAVLIGLLLFMIVYRVAR